MPIFSTTTTVHHESTIPRTETATIAKLVALLQDHEHYIRCNEFMTKYNLVPAENTVDSPWPSSLSDDIASRVVDTSPAAWPRYRMTNVIHALPAGLWDSEIVSNYEFIKLKDGVLVRISGPMDIMMESMWTVTEITEKTDKTEKTEKIGEGDKDERKRGEGGGEDEGAAAPAAPAAEGGSYVKMTEDVRITCSRIMAHFIKKKCDEGYGLFHERMMAPLKTQS